MVQPFSADLQGSTKHIIQNEMGKTLTSKKTCKNEGKKWRLCNRFNVERSENINMHVEECSKRICHLYNILSGKVYCSGQGGTKHKTVELDSMSSNSFFLSRLRI